MRYISMPAIRMFAIHTSSVLQNFAAAKGYTFDVCETNGLPFEFSLQYKNEFRFALTFGFISYVREKLFELCSTVEDLYFKQCVPTRHRTLDTLVMEPYIMPLYFALISFQKFTYHSVSPKEIVIALCRVFEEISPSERNVLFPPDYRYLAMWKYFWAISSLARTKDWPYVSGRYDACTAEYLRQLATNMRSVLRNLTATPPAFEEPPSADPPTQPGLTCIICCERPIFAVFTCAGDTGHRCACYKCATGRAKDMSTCPICRAPGRFITRIIDCGME